MQTLEYCPIPYGLILCRVSRRVPMMGTLAIIPQLPAHRPSERPSSVCMSKSRDLDARSPRCRSSDHAPVSVPVQSASLAQRNPEAQEDRSAEARKHVLAPH